jgi:hypothetical protein
MANVEIDQNSRQTLGAISYADGKTIIPLYADPNSHRLLTLGLGGLVVGGATPTQISGGSGSTNFLYDNNGVLAEGLPTATITIGSAVSGGTASQLLATDGSTNLQNLAVATYPSLTEISYVKGVTSAIQTQLNGKTPTITATTTIYVNGTTGNDSTGTGSIALPFKTVSKAITIGNALSAAYAIFLAPNTYTDAAQTISQPVIIYGNGSTYTVATTGLTLSNAFSIYDLTINGSLVQGDTSLFDFTYLANTTINGNITCNGYLYTSNLNQFGNGSNTTFTVNAGAFVLLTNTTLGAQSAGYYTRVVNSGSLFLSFVDVFASDNSNYALTSTGSSKLTLNASLILNAGTGGGINCSNGATIGNPNEITSTEVFVNGTTNAITCSTAISFVDMVKCFNSNDGSVVLPTGSAISNCYFGAVGIIGATSGATILQSSAVASGTLTFPATTDTLIARATTDTLTNKRVTKRVLTTNAPGATPTTNTDNVDIQTFTGLATAITSMTTNLSGTPVDGDKLEFRFLDNGTAQGITWGTSFVSSGTITLPATTVISTLLRVGFEYQTTNSVNKWVCIATA